MRRSRIASRAGALALLAMMCATPSRAQEPPLISADEVRQLKEECLDSFQPALSIVSYKPFVWRHPSFQYFQPSEFEDGTRIGGRDQNLFACYGKDLAQARSRATRLCQAYYRAELEAGRARTPGAGNDALQCAIRGSVSERAEFGTCVIASTLLYGNHGVSCRANVTPDEYPLGKDEARSECVGSVFYISGAMSYGMMMDLAAECRNRDLEILEVGLAEALMGELEETPVDDIVEAHERTRTPPELLSDSFGRMAGDIGGDLQRALSETDAHYDAIARDALHRAQDQLAAAAVERERAAERARAAASNRGSVETASPGGAATSDAEQERLMRSCIARQCRNHRSKCEAGSVSACYLAQACTCECELRVRPPNHARAPELRQCVDEGKRNANDLRG